MFKKPARKLFDFLALRQFWIPAPIGAVTCVETNPQTQEMQIQIVGLLACTLQAADCAVQPRCMILGNYSSCGPHRILQTLVFN